MKSFQQYLEEKAPPGEKAEQWIKDNKEKFKNEYGNNWEEILYATAWKIFGESIEIIEPDDREYLTIDDINEESMTSSTTTAGVDNPDAKPMSFKRSKFMDKECIEVDEDTYHKCVQGKIPFKRWARYVEDENLRSEMKSLYYKNKKLLMKNRATGAMAFVK